MSAVISLSYQLSSLTCIRSSPVRLVKHLLHRHQEDHRHHLLCPPCPALPQLVRCGRRSVTEKEADRRRLSKEGDEESDCFDGV
ncbi:hypothetical protein KC19_7G080600 [Ceratodon purpureus]|uniref:Uncharacterized protein n=1 Tax=Ceratodon purpureus TaxID=3225 RepID=A0A8T0H8J7_CERPU|nr:hypothetical protein KC19_7G080600 [Ceratodon purpureus]